MQKKKIRSNQRIDADRADEKKKKKNLMEFQMSFFLGNAGQNSASKTFKKKKNPTRRVERTLKNRLVPKGEEASRIENQTQSHGNFVDTKKKSP